MKVLISEPSEFWRDLAAYAFRREGFEVVPIAGLAGVADWARKDAVDLIVLSDDRPETGEVVRACRDLRGVGPMLVVVLSAGDELSYLAAGADGVGARPPNLELLVARCRALARRLPATAALSEQGPLRLLGDGTALVNGRPVRLSRYEERLLGTLARHAGRPVSRDELLRECWGPHFEGASSQIDVYVNRLRRKVEPDPARPQLIVTVRGTGYVLRVATA